MLDDNVLPQICFPFRFERTMRTLEHLDFVLVTMHDHMLLEVVKLEGFVGAFGTLIFAGVWSVFVFLKVLPSRHHRFEQHQTNRAPHVFSAISMAKFMFLEQHLISGFEIAMFTLHLRFFRFKMNFRMLADISQLFR